MSVDTALGVFGASTGVIGILLAYYFYKKSVRTKVLAIAYTDPIPRLLTVGDLQVAYEGELISALSSVYILLWNRGTAPIESSDFLSPVTFSASLPILNLQIQDKDPAAAVGLNEKTREVSIGLLRPGEAVTLVAEVASEAYRPDINVEMKSADMSAFISGLHFIYPSILSFLTFVFLLALEFFVLYIVKQTSVPYEPPPPFFPYSSDPGAFLLLGFVASLLIVPGICAVIVYRIARGFFAKTITPVAWKFSEFKVSALNMRVQLKQFRKVIDANYKKISPN